MFACGEDSICHANVRQIHPAIPGIPPIRNAEFGVETASLRTPVWAECICGVVASTCKPRASAGKASASADSVFACGIFPFLTGFGFILLRELQVGFQRKVAQRLQPHPGRPPEGVSYDLRKQPNNVRCPDFALGRGSHQSTDWDIAQRARAQLWSAVAATPV